MTDEERPERHNAFGVKRKARFLAALAETCNVRLSAARAGVVASTAYSAYRKDPAFAAGWMEALAEGYVRLEERLLAHAIRSLRNAEGPPADAEGEAEDPLPKGDRPLKAPEAGAGAVAGNAPFTDTRLALSLLSRHRGNVEAGHVRPKRGRWTATEEEVEVALRKQLDALKKRLEKKR